MAEQARGMLSEGVTRFAECVKPEHLEAVAAAERVRALHIRSDRPVVTTSLCASHGTRERLRSLRDRAAHDEMRAMADACPDCTVSEKYVCTHCRAECPDDDEWPCATMRVLEPAPNSLATPRDNREG